MLRKVPILGVALRKESVDRNFYYADKDADWVRSLSARRAWIEMPWLLSSVSDSLVALRKESVDRNAQRRDFKRLGLLSLSARRAWIEIIVSNRNRLTLLCRSPQGERG